MKHYTRRIFLGATAFGMTFAAAGCAGLNMSGSSNVPFDQQFIDMMVPHHQGAVEMAKIAQQRGEHAEVKKMAQDVIGSQSSEIEKMTSWRKQWFGSDKTPPMNQMPIVEGSQMAADGAGGMGGMNHSGSTAATTMDMSADVEKLRKAPEPFDRAFIDAMIPHHESAIDAAKASETRAQKPEIKQLAKEVIAAQQKEIEQMKGWRKAWFNA